MDTPQDAAGGSLAPGAGTAIGGLAGCAIGGVGDYFDALCVAAETYDLVEETCLGPVPEIPAPE